MFAVNAGGALAQPALLRDARTTDVRVFFVFLFVTGQQCKRRVFGQCFTVRVRCTFGRSVILYDARTWHRMGENRSNEPRPCVPLATIPGYVALSFVP